jgi:hypothetical protein
LGALGSFPGIDSLRESSRQGDIGWESWNQESNTFERLKLLNFESENLFYLFVILLFLKGA